MAPLKFINLLAISSLAVFACSFIATPVAALATDIHHIRDISAHGHGAIARRKRATPSSSKRCRQRPSNSTTTTVSGTPKATTKPDPKAPKADPKAVSSTSTSASKAVSTSTSSSTVSGGGGKIGLGWPNGPDMAVQPFLTKKVSYLYTWDTGVYPNAAALGLECMPMLWGENMVSAFASVVKKGYAQIAMGMNECNEPGQSNLTPARAAQLWLQYIEPLSNEGYKWLVSPSTSSNPNGKVWYSSWLAACNGKCNPTHLSIHYYATTAAGFISYMELWHDTFKLPMMVTEFACQNFDGGAQCSESEVQDFMTTSINWMESSSFVTAYFAFGVMKEMQGVNTLDQLMNSAGKPTALGEQYINGM